MLLGVVLLAFSNEMSVTFYTYYSFDATSTYLNGFYKCYMLSTMRNGNNCRKF